MWQPDQMPEKTVQIREILELGVVGINVPIVVYVHCGHGQDRTGEMAGSYELQYLTWSFQQIWSYNVGILD